jgi:hypothetical protein
MIKYWYYKIRYRKAISLIAKGTDIGQIESFTIIKKYRKVFEILYGRNFVHEVILNYMVHYKNNKVKVIDKYKNTISQKHKHHKSDIAISVNVLHKFKLNNSEKKIVFDVISKYFNSNLPNALLQQKAEKLVAEGKLNR